MLLVLPLLALPCIAAPVAADNDRFAAAVGTSQGELWRECLGRCDYGGGPPVTPESLFDLGYERRIRRL